MEAKVTRGFFLQVQDEKGSYRIPIGRRGRRCLIVLDKKEGEYVRSLEIDLFTGIVYYCVDNETSGGLSYYYDMSSKKVSHYFIHRYLRLAAARGFGASPEEKEVFEKLPCDNWVEEIEKLPGWKEAIEHRIDQILLPETEPVRIPVSRADGAFAAAPDAAGPDIPEGGTKTIVFSRYLAAYPSQAGKYVFQFTRNENGYVLQHLDENIGKEFFGENEEYERFLTAEEYAWIWKVAEGTFKGGAQIDASCAAAAAAPAGDRLSDGAGMVTKEIEFRTDGPGMVTKEAESSTDGAGAAEEAGAVSGQKTQIQADDGAAQSAANILYNVLRGLLRREIELV